MSLKILLVDDDGGSRNSINNFLIILGHNVVQCENGQEALQKFSSDSYDLVLSDIKMPKLSGLDLLKEVAKTGQNTEFVLFTGHGSMDTAIEALRLGAYDYLLKPVNAEQLGALLEGIEAKLKGKRPLKIEKNVNNNGFVAKYFFQNIIFISPSMKGLIDKAKLISKSDQPVLIKGESGTGKELLANAIHNDSQRKDGPFVSVNCASFQPDLITSELFGYADGAFTGAVKGGKKGKIELADKGTLFLDEIGDMPLPAQALLLRVLQENELIKIGDDKLTKINIRIICASNKDIRQLCEQNYFRWDLYYRLAGIVLEIPPLRYRKEDINPLITDFLDRKYPLEIADLREYITPEALGIVNKYHWPGNVRELVNTLETACILANNGKIDDLIISDLLQIHDFVDNTLDIKKKKLPEIIKQTNGNVSKTAEILGVSRPTIYKWLKE